MKTETAPTLYYRGTKMDTSPSAFGELRRSDTVVHDRAALRSRMDDDGYLFLPGLLNRDDVDAARVEIFHRLARGGFLAPGSDPAEGIAAPDIEKAAAHDLAVDNPALMKVVFDGPMMDFFRFFFDDEVRHFDNIWLRAKSPGGDNAAQPHYDIVFMGRGTTELYTAWTPMMDVAMEMGGLIVLEGSHRLERVRNSYGTLDVDRYCTNYADASEIESGTKRWQDHVQGGAYSPDAIGTREELGGRWLTANYRAGDVLVFSMFTMHASMDNQTNRFRISSDTRYQRAKDPADPRWVGEHPEGHGPGSKIGMIC